MNTKPLGIVCVLLFGAAALCAQPAAEPPPGSPPPPPPPLPYTPPSYGPPNSPAYYGGPDSSLRWAGAITLPYAFNWNALGITGELGGLWLGQHFFGGQISYFDGDPVHYRVYNSSGYIGSFRAEQEVTTVGFAYRYFAPLDISGPGAPVAFYLGGNAGVGFVNYSNDGYGFGFHNDNNGTFSGDLLAGFQFNAEPRLAYRLGYRYVYVNDAWQFDRRANLDSSVLEASIAFRF